MRGTATEQNVQTQAQRIVWMDVLRILATWGVICIHTSGDARFNMEQWTFGWMATAVWGMLTGPWCVPCFIMMSGALFLAKQQAPSIHRILSHNIPKLIGARLCTAAALCAVGVAISMRAGNMDMALIWSYTRQDGAMWFVIMMIGLYLVTPILYEVCKSRVLEQYFIVLCFVFSVAIPTLKNVPVLENILTPFLDTMMVHLPLGYTLYYLLGHYIVTYWKDMKIKAGQWVAALVAVFALSVMVFYFQNKYDNSAWEYLVNREFPYDSLLNVLFAIVVFLTCFQLVSKIHWNEKMCRIIRHLGRRCIGIYALHIPILYLFEAAFGFRILSFGFYILGVILEVTAIFCLGYLATCVWSKIPLFKKVLE
ncbi:MAG: acyltransferase family protein [Ruthenibacterium sp.]